MLVNFLSRQWGIENPEKTEFSGYMYMEWEGKETRPPLYRYCTLSEYADRERVMRNTFKLKNTNFTIYVEIFKNVLFGSVVFIL